MNESQSEVLTIEWLGQSGFIYQFPCGATICVDPYLSYADPSGGTRERLVPPPRCPSELKANVVILTHDHTDHFDEHTLRFLVDVSNTLFVGPSSCRNHWLTMDLPTERFLQLDRGQILDIAGVRLKAIHAEHSSGDMRDAIGVVVENGAFTIYQVGDSEYVPSVVEAAEKLHIDVMTVPINGRKGNMDAKEAAMLAGKVRPRLVVPMHYGMFRTNTANPRRFVDFCHEYSVSAQVIVASVGERYKLDARAKNTAQRRGAEHHK